MGAGSIAMFQVGDTTQQVHVGGQVGQSGWQVKEVREQEVVLTRAGQNRTLIVGQALTD
jgi:Tfp pilus assembly protein PilP